MMEDLRVSGLNEDTAIEGKLLPWLGKDNGSI